MAARPKRKYRCRACRGTGYEGCRSCGGSGELNVRKPGGRARRGNKAQPEVTSERCGRCRGTGRGARCPMCDGGWRSS